MTIPNAQSLYNANGGSTSTSPFITIMLARDPEVTDIYGQNGQYLSGQRWINTATNQEFYLDGYTSTGGTVLANWEPLAPSTSGVIETLTGANGGGPVGPDMSSNVNFIGSGISIIGNPATHTLTFTNTETQGTIIVAADVGTITGTTIEISGGTTGLTTNAVSATRMNLQGVLGVANGGTGDSSFTSNSVLISGATSTAALIPIPLSNGQIIIGATGAAPAAASLIPGSNITIIPGPNSITISASEALGGSLIVNEQIFTSNATYIPTAGMVYCYVREVGGGAAGGGGAATGANQLSSGSGGGSGEYAEGIFTMSNIGSSQNVIIGSGGIGSSGTTGGSGTNTSFGTLMSAFGGSGGLTIPATNVAAAATGGDGGTGGSGGSIRIPGTKGDGAVTDHPGSFALAGRGGASILGTSGFGYTGQGLAAAGYGGGGGGTENDVNSSAASGGNGTSGVVIVTEYIVGGIASGIVVPAQGGTGISNPTIHTVPIAEGSSAFNFVGPGISGYVLMANGALADPSFQAIPSSTFTWNTVSGTSQAVAVANGYFANNAAPASMYLPSTAAVGNEIKFSNQNTGGFLVIPAPGQTVNFLSQSATNPSYFSTSSIYAAMDLVCETANTAWNVVNHEGTFTSITAILPFQAAACYNGLEYLKLDGSSWGCGVNAAGQLGNNTMISYSSPIAVVGNHSFIQLAAADIAFFGLKADGSCWAWGDGGAGQMGNNTMISYSSPIAVVGNHSFIKISGGSLTGYGLKADGSCWAWGNDAAGQLGNNSTTPTSSPVSVVGNHSFIKISGGNTNFYGLKADGSCWACGNNQFGELGNNSINNASSPIAVVGNHSFIQISGGSNSAYGLKADGSCWAWGYNAEGQLGNNSVTYFSSPIAVVGNHSFIQITGSFQSAYGLKADGSCWAWGQNSSGQLGNNSTTSTSSPVSVVGNISFFKLISELDSISAYAWTSNRNLWSWGDNTGGSLGNNSTINTSSPIIVLNTP